MTTIALSAAEIIHALGGRGNQAKCPAHKDRTPSLSVTERDGKVLVHCHAGCSQTAVITALRDLGLWPEQEQRRWLPQAEFDAQRRRAQEQEQEDEKWLPSMRDFLRELTDRRDELIRLLRIRDDFYLEVELEVCYMRIDAMRKAIGDDVTEDDVAFTIAIVDMLAEKQANETQTS